MKTTMRVIRAVICIILSLTLLICDTHNPIAFVVREKNPDYSLHCSEDTTNAKNTDDNSSKNNNSTKISKILKWVLVSIFSVLVVVASAIIGKKLCKKLKGNPLAENNSFHIPEPTTQAPTPNPTVPANKSQKLSFDESSTLIYTEYDEEDEPIYDYDSVINRCAEFAKTEDDGSKEYNEKYIEVRQAAINQCNENIRYINHNFIQRDIYPEIQPIHNFHDYGYVLIDEKGSKTKVSKRDIIAELCYILSELNDIPKCIYTMSSLGYNEPQATLINRFNFYSEQMKKNKINSAAFQEQLENKFDKELAQVFDDINEQIASLNFSFSSNKEWRRIDRIMQEYTRPKTFECMVGKDPNVTPPPVSK